MEYYRYGKFRFGDYWGSWEVILIFIFGSIACFMFGDSIILSIYPIICAVVRLSSILLPNRERFSIDGDIITIKIGKKIRQKTIPKDAVLVISQVDIRPPLSGRSAVEKQTHILKDKYAVSILQNMSLESALHYLHLDYAQEYTTSMIEDHFVYRCLYSFVFDEDLLNRLLYDKEYLVIIPESLADKVSIDRQKVKTYIDVGF